MAGKMLINILQNAVDSKLRVLLDEIFQPVEQLVFDQEASVRSSLVEWLPHVVIICNEAPELFCGNLTSRILNIVLLYLGDSMSQVRQDAQAALKVLLERDLLDDDQIEQGVCNTILKFSQSDDQDLNIMALSLMAKINMYISSEFVEQVFLDRFLELCSSENALIRKECASVMGEFCKLMSKESIYNKLLPVYINLCLDTIWHVRRNAVDMMMSITRCVPLSIRRRLLSMILVSHLSDESRWVRYSAYEILGPFISTFAKQFHELIYDQKGELVLVHESDRGWPRFNVVPVVQSHTFSKVLFDDVGVIEDYSKIRRRYLSRPKKIRMKKDSNEKFNLFQYYYNPPDMPLDPELVYSVTGSNITHKDNDVNTQNVEDPKNNENKADCSKDVNKNLNNEGKNQQHYRGNQNSDNNDQQKDNNENKENQEINEDMRNIENKYNECNENKEIIDNSENKESNEKDDDKQEINSLQITDLDEERKLEILDHLSSSKSPTKVVNTTYNFNDTINLSSNSLDQSSSSDLSNLRMTILASLNYAEDEADDNEIVPDILIRHFISMVDIEIALNGIDKDLDYHCAYCFPAVVLTLGKDKWHELLSAYQKMAKSKKWNIRSTLACSIHEIAIIIQKYLAARDLVPIFNGFIQDLEEVRIGALKHLSTFLNVLSPHDRLQYLPKFSEFLTSTDYRKWRLREELAKQLCYIIHLYKPVNVGVHIAPLVLRLMEDKVAAVRQEAIYTVARTVAYLSFSNDGTVAHQPCRNRKRAKVYQNNKDNSMAVTMIREMKNMIKERSTGEWIIRQTYALVCSKLASESVISGELFANELLNYLFDLSFDKVANVRLVVARTLSRDILCMPDFPKKNLDDVKEKLKEMQMDSDRDVRFFAGGE